MREGQGRGGTVGVASAGVLQGPTAAANGVFYPALDGLRAVALAAVFVDHFCGIGLFGLGVNVFLVLSGFLITGILWDTRDQPHRMRNFYVRRTLRIFPLYYGVFLLLLVLTPVAHWQWNSAWALWPTHVGNYIFFLPEWLPRAEWLRTANGMLSGRGGLLLLMGHFWSLCLEEQFYLVWPWIVFRTTRRGLLRMCVGVAVVLPVLRGMAASMAPPAAIRAGVLQRTLPFQIDAFLLGGLLALLLRGSGRERLLRWAGPVSTAAVVYLAGYTYCRIDLHLRWLHQPFPGAGGLTWDYSVIDVLAVALILGALKPGTPLFRVLHLRPMRWVGRLSYGAYIFHDMPRVEYQRVLAPLFPGHVLLMTAVVGAAMMLVMAWLSFRFVEMPFLRLKDRWTRRRA